jgi:hypothetical protein
MLKRVVLWIAASLATACGSNSGHGLSPDPDCDRYLACVSTAMPMAFSGALNAYGEASACWATPAAAQACRNACLTARQQLGNQCGCSSNADCVSAGTPICDTTSKQCVPCKTNADCKSMVGGLYPYCWVRPGYLSQCVDRCGTNSDCSSATPVCFFVSDGHTSCGTCNPFDPPQQYCAPGQLCGNDGACHSR